MSDFVGPVGAAHKMQVDADRIANGAGIAADPTLTDAWPCSFIRRSRDADLASDVFPSVPSEDFTSGSITGARTGIRIYPPLGPVSVASQSEDRSLTLPSRASTGGSAAMPSIGGGRLTRSHRLPVRRPLYDATFAHPAGLAWLTSRNLRTSVIDPPCFRYEPSARGSRKVRGQIPRRLPGSEFLSSFKSLDRREEKFSSPFR